MIVCLYIAAVALALYIVMSKHVTYLNKIHFILVFSLHFIEKSCKKVFIILNDSIQEERISVIVVIEYKVKNSSLIVR